ncbi:MAG: 4a-hydroxytetrahydrobiopterin dehydratase [Pseudomonadales bacterium]
MTQLSNMECDVCKTGAPPVSAEDCQQLLAEIPDWELFGAEGTRRLRRKFLFRNFAESIAFTNQVGEIAEEADHHPEILTEWGKVTVTWWTHKINGLHLNDFIMATKTDALSGYQH